MSNTNKTYFSAAVSAIIVSLIGFLLNYLLLFLIFYTKVSFYKSNNVLDTFLSKSLFVVSGASIIIAEMLFSLIAKKTKLLSGKNSIIALITASVLYALLMLFAFDHTRGSLYAYLPTNNELSSGYTVFAVQLLAIPSAAICLLVNIVRLLITKKE